MHDCGYVFSDGHWLRTGAVTISDSAGGGTQNITLVGTGTAPGVSLNPSSLTFGSAVAGTTAAAQSVTLTNIGSSPLRIATLTASGDFALDAGTTCSVSTPVAAANTCTIAVTFTPTASGVRTGVVTITDNASGGSQTITLSGTGTAPGVMLTPSSLSFGSTVVGTTAAAQSVTLTNTGTSPLSITALESSGDFTLDPSTTCSTSSPVAASTICTIAVTFSPTASGVRTGVVTITDNVSGGTQTIALAGTGAPSTDFSLSLNGSGTQTVTSGNTATYLFTVAPLYGQYSGTVNLSVNGLPSGATAAFSPSSVAANGGTQTITLRVQTSATSATTRGLPPAALPAIFLAMMLTALVGWWRVRRESLRWAVAPGLLFAALLATTFMAGCGGGGYPLSNVGGTPSGTYTITVTGTSGTMQHSTTVTLIVTAY